jgi:hypothetical protein
MTTPRYKIDADDRTLFDVLSDRKYTVDFFQREYRWQHVHVEQLITDLTSTFLASYRVGDPRHAVAQYTSYFLGPIVLSNKAGHKSIIDGQQRLISLTLLLIFLSHLQKESGSNETIEPLIFAERYGTKSFNINVPERTKCFEALFRDGYYTPQPGDDESIRAMAQRYADIDELFPDELKGAALPYFLDWLKYNVMLVEITAYADENAYTVFESMNDRGLHLTASEMLKSFVLARIDEPARARANQHWKHEMQALHEFATDEDLKFFQAWFRGQYASTLHPGPSGADDFAHIGMHFHRWFRDHLAAAHLRPNEPADFQVFVHETMSFYAYAYRQILAAQQREIPGWEHVFYQHHWRIADALSMPLMLAPLRLGDSADIMRQKITMVAHFLESYTVRRALSFRKSAVSSVRFPIYTLVNALRGADIATVTHVLQRTIADMPEQWYAVVNFRLHGTNRQFVKFLLARICGFIDQQSGASTNFSTYYLTNTAKPFEIEHIWADVYHEHRDEFPQQHEFDAYRNRIGGLVLLPQGTNQSYGALPYADKLPHYLREHSYVQSLHAQFYENNPNFIGMMHRLGLPFRPHQHFRKDDIDDRQRLVQRLCAVIWM